MDADTNEMSPGAGETVSSRPAWACRQMSDSIARLAAALARAQAEMAGAVRSSVNPYFSSRYADLESTWAACRGPLTKQGLSVVQLPYSDGPIIGVETLLLHESGEFIRGRIAITSAQPTNPQATGSIITYLRRYSLQAAVGIAPEDDDGVMAARQSVPAEGGQDEPGPDAGSRSDDVVASIRAATSLADLQRIWADIPVGSRRLYVAEKDAAKRRLSGKGGSGE